MHSAKKQNNYVVFKNGQTSPLDNEMLVIEVPWWNKRTRLERRLILTALGLLLLISILIAALVLTVQSFSDTVSTLSRSSGLLSQD